MNKLMLGDVELDLIPDAVGEIEGDSVFAPASQDQWSALVPSSAEGLMDIAVRPMLIKDADGYILVDTGFGTVKSEEESQTGDTLAELAKRSIDPRAIGRVIITHAHGDHCLGNCVLQDDTWVPAFPDADYYIQTAECDFIKREDPEMWRTRFQPVERAGKLRLLDGDTALSDTVECLLTRGHTIGHQSVLVESGGKSALYVADLYISPGNVTHPDWGPDWAWSREDDIANRKKIAGWAAEHKAILIIAHDPTQPFYTVQIENGNYKLAEVTAR